MYGTCSNVKLSNTIISNTKKEKCLLQVCIFSKKEERTFFSEFLFFLIVIPASRPRPRGGSVCAADPSNMKLDLSVTISAANSLLFESWCRVKRVSLLLRYVIGDMTAGTTSADLLYLHCLHLALILIECRLCVCSMQAWMTPLLDGAIAWPALPHLPRGDR